MKSRRCMSDPKLRRWHLSDSNTFFDRGENRHREHFRWARQCRLWVKLRSRVAFGESPLISQQRTFGKALSAGAHGRSSSSRTHPRRDEFFIGAFFRARGQRGKKRDTLQFEKTSDFQRVSGTRSVLRASRSSARSARRQMQCCSASKDLGQRLSRISSPNARLLMAFGQRAPCWSSLPAQ